MGEFLIRDANIQIGLNGYVTIRIYSDGTVENAFTERQLGRGVWLPSHGDLIDRDELIGLIRESSKSASCDYEPEFTWREIGEMEIADLSKFPVIIPASEKEV